MNSSPTNFILLDKLMTRNAFFELDTQNPDLLAPIWVKVDESYNKGTPPGSAYKTGKQLSKSYRNAVESIKKQQGLDGKKDRDEIITLWKKKIFLLAEREEIAGMFTISLLLILTKRCE